MASRGNRKSVRNPLSDLDRFCFGREVLESVLRAMGPKYLLIRKNRAAILSPALVFLCAKRGDGSSQDYSITCGQKVRKKHGSSPSMAHPPRLSPLFAVVSFPSKASHEADPRLRIRPPRRNPPRRGFLVLHPLFGRRRDTVPWRIRTRLGSAPGRRQS